MNKYIELTKDSWHEILTPLHLADDFLIRKWLTEDVQSSFWKKYEVPPVLKNIEELLEMDGDFVLHTRHKLTTTGEIREYENEIKSIKEWLE